MSQTGSSSRLGWLKARKRRPDVNGNMTLIAHLAELRTRILIVSVALLVGATVAFVFWNRILAIATGPYCEAQAARGITTLSNGASACQLYISDPLQLFTTRITVSIELGLVLAAPVILWQLWRFVTPGLNQNEKRFAVPFVLSSVVLFAAGCAVAWWTVPKAMQFFLAVGGTNIQTLFNPTPYLKLVFLMVVLFGLAFETPLFLIFLQMARVISSRQLRDVRRYAIVVNAVAAAVITPSQDPYSMMALFIPLVVFYEVAILVGRGLRK